MRFTDTTPSLFNEPMSVTEHSSHPRKAEIKRAFERADKWVIDTYTKVLMEYGRRHSTFGAWDITAVYVAKHGPLSVTNRKALGGLFASLLEQGVIIDAGTGKRPNGNIATIYRLRGVSA
jgi:hypothetical protein